VGCSTHAASVNDGTPHQLCAAHAARRTPRNAP
jgi:hypothetical protein